MPQVKYAAGALRDLQRLREFLQPKNPSAAKRAGETIILETAVERTKGRIFLTFQQGMRRQHAHCLQ